MVGKGGGEGRPQVWEAGPKGAATGNCNAVNAIDGFVPQLHETTDFVSEHFFFFSVAGCRT
jgi:hypothetical protein